MTKKHYVGLKDGKREVFSSYGDVSTETHGQSFNAVIGPFNTFRAAKAMAAYGGGNPHMATVADCERLVRKGLV